MHRATALYVRPPGSLTIERVCLRRNITLRGFWCRIASLGMRRWIWLDGHRLSAEGQKQIILMNAEGKVESLCLTRGCLRLTRDSTGGTVYTSGSRCLMTQGKSTDAELLNRYIFLELWATNR
jgi:hypothetical protein